jgi:hypothetical protein
MQKITTAIASAAESSGSARDCGIWTNFIAIDRAARALKDGAASRDDGNANHHHWKSGIVGRGCDERAGVFSSKMGWAPATNRINKDVQLDQKKTKCGYGQAGTYPGKKGSLVRCVVCVVSDH